MLYNQQKPWYYCIQPKHQIWWWCWVNFSGIILRFWYPIFHRRFGICFTLDLSKHGNYKLIDFNKHPVAPTLKFYFVPNLHPWTWMMLLLHTSYRVRCGGCYLISHPKHLHRSNMLFFWGSNNCQLNKMLAGTPDMKLVKNGLIVLWLLCVYMHLCD